VVDLGSLKDFKTFGNGLAAAQVLDVKGKVLRCIGPQANVD
jgi:hypothetical protein